MLHFNETKVKKKEAKCASLEFAKKNVQNEKAYFEHFR